ncbi:hypothetical protein CHS0354_024888 [Potamilus streckersoni]|uniref:Hexosyltransferase n=1 Tax=Potamilus streckersoni TaxID=2493646 RepID=A0AAE0WDH7_9BIVA|nr:hypothetical protein CHS0354_024888 [Potamilus streckersoni]
MVSNTNSRKISSNHEQTSNNTYVGPVPKTDNILNIFVSAATVQWILRYILVVTVVLGMFCISMSVYYTSTLNHTGIIRPRVTDPQRLTWSQYGPKSIVSNNGNTFKIDTNVTKHNYPPLKYSSPTFAGVSNSSSRHTKTQYPLTLDTPYLLSNPNLCKSMTNLSVLAIVHTTPDHFERREVIRRTWTNNSYFHHLMSVRVLFLLGTVLDNTTHTKIEDEFIKHGDLVQGNFIDSYRNLTHKGVMGYKWISENCMNAKMIVKVDDDVVVDTYKLLSEYVLKLSGRTRYILCNHIAPGTMPIIRETKSKWFVDSDLFRGHKFYPRYCSGFGVIISTDIIPFLYRAAYLTPFFWVDDVYLYGMLPSKIKNVAYISLAGNFSLNFKAGLDCIKNNTKQCPFLICGGGTPDEVVKIWNAMGQAYKRTLKINLNVSNTKFENDDNTKVSVVGQGKTDSDSNHMSNIPINKKQTKAVIANRAQMPANKTQQPGT